MEDFEVINVVSESDLEQKYTKIIDKVICILIKDYSLDEKDVRKRLSGHLPKSSFYNRKYPSNLERPSLSPSGYIRFAVKERNNLMKLNPDLTMTRATAQVAQMWKSLSEADKEKYHNEYRIEKEEYNKKLEEFNNKMNLIRESLYNESEEDVNNDDDEEDGDDDN